MKRLIAVVLSLVLVAAMSTTAFATEATEDVSGNSHEVLASYESGTEDRTIVSVDISWEQMTFTYKGPSVPVWNAEEQRYEGETTEGGWEEGTGTITIRNNSNAVLQANIGYNQEPGHETVSMAFTDQSPFIGSAHTDDQVDEEGIAYGTPCEVTIKAIPTGTLQEGTEDNTRVGTITIALNVVEDIYTMLDELDAVIYSCNIPDTSVLERGGAFLVSGTDAAALCTLVNNAREAYAGTGKPEPEVNVMINVALTSFYGALDIVQ